MVFLIAAEHVGGKLFHCFQSLLVEDSSIAANPCWWQTPHVVASPVEGGLLSLLATDPVVGSLIHCFSGSASSSVLPMLQSDSLLSNFCGGWCHFLRHPVGSKLPWQLVPLSIAAEVALDGLLPQHVVLDCCWILFVQRCLPPLFATRSCHQFLKRLMPLFVFIAMLRPRLVGEPCCSPLCLC